MTATYPTYALLQSLTQIIDGEEDRLLPSEFNSDGLTAAAAITKNPLEKALYTRLAQERQNPGSSQALSDEKSIAVATSSTGTKASLSQRSSKAKNPLVTHTHIPEHYDRAEITPAAGSTKQEIGNLYPFYSTLKLIDPRDYIIDTSIPLNFNYTVGSAPPKLKDSFTRNINLGLNFGQVWLGWIAYNKISGEIGAGKGITYGGQHNGQILKSTAWGVANKKFGLVLSVTAFAVCAARQWYLGSKLHNKHGDAKERANAEFIATIASGLSIFWMPFAVKKTLGTIPLAATYLVGYGASYLADAGIYFGVRKLNSNKSNEELLEETKSSATLGMIGGLGSAAVLAGLADELLPVLKSNKAKETFMYWGKNFTPQKMKLELAMAAVGIGLMLWNAVEKIQISKQRTDEVSDSITNQNNFIAARNGLFVATGVFFYAVTKGRSRALGHYFDPSYLPKLQASMGNKLGKAYHAFATSPIFKSYIAGSMSAMGAGVMTDYVTRNVQYFTAERKNDVLPIAMNDVDSNS